MGVIVMILIFDILIFLKVVTDMSMLQISVVHIIIFGNPNSDTQPCIVRFSHNLGAGMIERVFLAIGHINESKSCGGQCGALDGAHVRHPSFTITTRSSSVLDLSVIIGR